MACRALGRGRLTQVCSLTAPVRYIKLTVIFSTLRLRSCCLSWSTSFWLCELLAPNMNVSAYSFFGSDISPFPTPYRFALDISSPIVQNPEKNPLVYLLPASHLFPRSFTSFPQPPIMILRSIRRPSFALPSVLPLCCYDPL